MRTNVRNNYGFMNGTRQKRGGLRGDGCAKLIGVIDRVLPERLRKYIISKSVCVIDSFTVEVHTAHFIL